jgi:hypothetical protein
MTEQINKKIAIVAQQIRYCEEKLKEPNCDIDLLTNQLNIRQQLLKTFQNHQIEVV